jgi:hypothetical protein
VVEGELKFNFVGTTMLRHIHFSPAADSPAPGTSHEEPVKGIPVVLRVPVARTEGLRVVALADGTPQRLEVAPHESGGVSWAEVRWELTGRTRIEITTGK